MRPTPNEPSSEAHGGGEEPDPGGSIEWSPEMSLDMEPVMVTLTFETDRVSDLLAVLSRYVVLSRNEKGCRNIDLVASVTKPGRLLIVEKWESEEHQRAHFDGARMVEMANACRGLLTAPPNIDLHEAVTMHDLH